MYITVTESVFQETARHFFRSMVVLAFSSLVRISGECSTIHSSSALFFFEVEISSRTLIPLFMLGSFYSGSAS